MEPFKFPDEQQPTAKEAEDKQDEIEVSVEGADAEDVVVIDDTPPQDRGRKPLNRTPEEIAPDAEVEEYSAAVKKRISELTHTWHDERRAKEESRRERDEAVRVARVMFEENKKLRERADGLEQTGNEAKKQTAERELAAAQRDLKAAYEAGDSDAVTNATLALADAKLKLNEAANFRPTPLQPRESPVQPEPQTQVARPDERALAWAKANPWYGQDDEMTSFALGLHQKLVKTGVDPRADPDTYYQRLNARIREKFPEAFEDDSAATDESADAEAKPAARKASPATVVAPASRSTAPKRIVLSKSQEAIARSLGVPLKEYARQMRLLDQPESKRNG